MYTHAYTYVCFCLCVYIYNGNNTHTYTIMTIVITIGTSIIIHLRALFLREQIAHASGSTTSRTPRLWASADCL